MLRKLVIGSSVLALVPSVKAASLIPSEPQRPPPMKLEDLPVYEAPHAAYNEHIDEQNKSYKFSYVQSALDGPVKTFREQVQNVLQHTSTVTNAFSDNYHEIVDRSDWIVKYLREEENRDQRYGAVAIGGLTGFIFGLRGGFIRRLLYAGVGTSAMGAVCFPEETKQVYRSNGALLRTYVNIAYNFLYGASTITPQQAKDATDD